MPMVHTAPSTPGAHPVIPRDRLLRLPEVVSITGISKSTIYELMRKGQFPRHVKINRRMTAWTESAVLQWVQDRINDAQAPHPDIPAQVRK